MKTTSENPISAFTTEVQRMMTARNGPGVQGLPTLPHESGLHEALIANKASQRMQFSVLLPS